jgi:hypothetical protein
MQGSEIPMRRTSNPLEPRTPPAAARQAAACAAAPPATPPPADHHLWRNGRLWWIAITLYDAHGRRRRVRESLGTRDVVEARRQRDQFLRRVRREGRFRVAAPARRATDIAEATDTAGAPADPRAGVAA